MTLTRAGEDFLKQALAILERAEDALQRARAIGAGTAGILNVGLTGSVLTGPLGRAIQQFALNHPDVDLCIHEMSPDRQVAALKSGQTDVSFLRCPPQDVDIVSVSAWTESVRVVLPKGHALSAKKIALSDLGSESFVFLRLEDSLFAKYLWQCCFEAGFAPRITHQAIESASLISLVAAGLGVAIIPEFVSKLAHQDVVYRPIAGSPIRADVHALRTAAGNPLADRFVGLVQTLARPSG